jgi:hypothetical protein
MASLHLFADMDIVATRVNFTCEVKLDIIGITIWASMTLDDNIVVVMDW